MSLYDAIAQIKEAIKKYTGRDASDGEILSVHLSGGRHYGPENVAAAITSIAGSPEAKTFGQAPAAAATTTPATSDPFETRPQAGDFGRMEGYAANNWGSMNSMKYRAGEILARYAPTPEGLKQAFADPDFTKLFPNAKLVGHDSIDFGGMLSDFDRGVGVGRVDVGLLFDKDNNTGRAWGWQDQGNTGGSMGGASETWKYKGPLASTPTVTAPAAGQGHAPMPPNTAPPETSMASLATMGQQPPQGQPLGQGDVYMSELARQRAQRIGGYI
jgi:hypothetical protein